MNNYVADENIIYRCDNLIDMLVGGDLLGGLETRGMWSYVVAAVEAGAKIERSGRLWRVKSESCQVVMPNLYDALVSFCDYAEIGPVWCVAEEYWIVSRWMSARLEFYGERVIDVGGALVWVRCSSGWILDDWVIKWILEEVK